MHEYVQGEGGWGGPAHHRPLGTIYNQRAPPRAPPAQQSETRRRGAIQDAGDAHRRAAVQASSRHATPGSTLPSSSSSEAPPPVEMWDI